MDRQKAAVPVATAAAMVVLLVTNIPLSLRIYANGAVMVTRCRAAARRATGTWVARPRKRIPRERQAVA
jgi:hypothetical protein